jgi:integrase
MAGIVRKRIRQTRQGTERITWLADYFDQHGKRHNKTFRTKRLADEWLLRRRSEIRDGIRAPEGADKTIAEAGREWLRHCEAEGLERGSVQQYAAHFKLYIKPLLGEMRLGQLSPPDAEAWRDELLKTLSRRRASLILSSLKSILKNAVRLGWVAANAASASRIDIKKREQEPLEIGRHIPTKQEIHKILATAPERWRPVLLTMAFTGIRTSEARGLTWDAVDLAGRVIHIRQRADFWNTLGAPKTAAGRRDIPLMPIIVKTLREWRLAYPYGSDGIVFCTRAHGNKGGVVNHGELWRVFRAAQCHAGIVDAAGQPKYHVHALRHFFACLGIEAGFAPKRLQTLLGHASMTMTYDVYGHLFPNPEDDHARLAAIERTVIAGGVSQ